MDKRKLGLLVLGLVISCITFYLLFRSTPDYTICVRRERAFILDQSFHEVFLSVSSRDLMEKLAECNGNLLDRKYIKKDLKITNYFRPMRS
jgi:hypothetical protein